MKKLIVTFLAVSSFALAADVKKGNFGAEIRGSSAESNAANKPSASPAKRNSYPFSGELDSQDGRSITIKGKKKNRVLLIKPDTRILRNGKVVKLNEAAPGERVSGSVRKNADGQEEASTVNLKGVESARK